MLKRGKLLFVLNDTGFFLSHRLNIARAAQKAGWDVLIATPNSSENSQLHDEGFTHVPIPLSRRGNNPIAELRTIIFLYFLFQKIRPQLIHAVTIKPVLYCGLISPFTQVGALVLAISGLGHVFISKGIIAGLRLKVVRLIYRFAFRHPRLKVIFQNNDDMKTLDYALKDEQSVLIPGSGVDPAEFNPTPICDEIPKIVLASRMLWTKGVGEFVEAARLLRKKSVQSRFILIGDPDPGNPKSISEKQLLRWVDSGDIEWWGRRDDIADIFYSAYAVCLPSYREGLPKVLIEAAAAGKAIITNDVPGCRDIVQNGDNGLLVAPNDSAKLAEAIEKLLDDPELCEKMGRRGREIFMERFTMEQVVNAHLSVYNSLACKL